MDLQKQLLRRVGPLSTNGRSSQKMSTSTIGKQYRNTPYAKKMHRTESKAKRSRPSLAGGGSFHQAFPAADSQWRGNHFSEIRSADSSPGCVTSCTGHRARGHAARMDSPSRPAKAIPVSPEENQNSWPARARSAQSLDIPYQSEPENRPADISPIFSHACSHGFSSPHTLANNYDDDHSNLNVIVHSGFRKYLSLWEYISCSSSTRKSLTNGYIICFCTLLLVLLNSYISQLFRKIEVNC